MIQYLPHHTEIDGRRSVQIVAVDVWPVGETAAAGSTRVLGSASLVDVEGPHPTVFAMHVLPAWRGNGIGSRLLQELIAAARHAKPVESGAMVYTIAHAENTDAIRFYRRHGFEAVSAPGGRMRRMLFSRSLSKM